MEKEATSNGIELTLDTRLKIESFFLVEDIWNEFQNIANRSADMADIEVLQGELA